MPLLKGIMFTIYKLQGSNRAEINGASGQADIKFTVQDALGFSKSSGFLLKIIQTEMFFEQFQSILAFKTF